MNARERARPDSVGRKSYETLAFRNAPELRPGRPIGERRAFWKGIVLGWATAWIGAFLFLALAGFGK